MIGSLGNAVFQVSSNHVFTFKNFTRSGAPRFEEHNVIGQKPVLEYVGQGLDTISFSVRLDVNLGVVPDKELERMRESASKGQVLPLILGGKYLGRWVITDLTEAHTAHDNRGMILVAEVQITLKEVAEDGDLYSYPAR